MANEQNNKFYIVTLLTIVLLSLGASSVSVNYIQWENEPNDSFPTASQLMTYNFNEAIIRGYISSSQDVDYWRFDYRTNLLGYQIVLQVPDGGYNYGVAVYEKIGNQYVFIARNNGDFI